MIIILLVSLISYEKHKEKFVWRCFIETTRIPQESNKLKNKIFIIMDNWINYFHLNNEIKT